MAEDIQRITGTSATVAARLCNFPTGQATLLYAHTDFLDKEVADVIRGMQGPWVDLFGYASRVGDAGFNMALSKQRINAVKQRISRYSSQVNFQIQQGFGESESGSNESDNSGYWRAVDVYVYASRPPPPHIKPKPHPTPVWEQIDWFVTALSLSGGSIIVGVGVGIYWGSITFEKPGRDKYSNTIAFAGPGIGLSLGIPGLDKLGKVGKLLEKVKIDTLLQYMQRSPLLTRALHWLSTNGGASASSLPSGTIGLVFPISGGMELQKKDFSGVCAVQYLSGTVIAGSAGTLAIWFGAPGGTSIFDPYTAVTKARGLALVSTGGLGIAASLGSSLLVSLGEIL